MNYIDKSKQSAKDLVLKAVEVAIKNEELKNEALPEFDIEIPKDTTNGDYATSVALKCAKVFGTAPKMIADTIVKNLEFNGSCFKSASVAGPGFINFVLCDEIYGEILKTANEMGRDYGKTDYLKGKKIMVEFVSANPTGPMHMGNARGGVLGDCLAEVLSRAGADVTREFLINDAGNQVNKFAESLNARYLQELKGEDACEFLEDYYQGDDIRELTKKFIDENGDKHLNVTAKERKQALTEYGLAHNIAKMKNDLARYKINYDVWFHESTLHAQGKVEETVNNLIKNGHAYKDDEGTIFIKSMELFEAERDDVLMRANGVYTYFAADIAYHYDKFITRSFDTVINIWGADHHGHVKRIQKAMDACGANGTENLEVVLMQLVRLMRNGEVARMSKRSGKSITLTDLLDEISIDAARFFFNLRASDTHLEFDLDLAIKEDSDNPVYYVSYAHARICSILQNLKAENIVMPSVDTLDLSLLTEKEEIALIKLVAELPEEIKNSAFDRDPSKINKYAISLATAFHKFYNAVRIRDAEENVRFARMYLCLAVKIAINNSLDILGIEAPEKM